MQHFNLNESTAYAINDASQDFLAGNTIQVPAIVSVSPSVASECALCGFECDDINSLGYCPDCQQQIDDAEAEAEYTPHPRRIDWRRIFGNEDETCTLNTFYSGVEA